MNRVNYMDYLNGKVVGVTVLVALVVLAASVAYMGATTADEASRWSAVKLALFSALVAGVYAWLRYKYR